MGELLPWVKGHYVGVGSSKTPEQVLGQMRKVASFLAKRGYVLRSGGGGADSAFEGGCDEARGMKQTWSTSKSYFPFQEWATEKASRVCWEYPLEKMSASDISSITTKVYQVFGDSEELCEVETVDFVVYWSEGNPLEKGGTLEGSLYAVRVAHLAGIKTYNLRTQKEEFANFLRTMKDS